MAMILAVKESEGDRVGRELRDGRVSGDTKQLRIKVKGRVQSGYGCYKNSAV